jgi:two-component system, NarL family, captular synthesis response regulator RcsB
MFKKILIAESLDSILLGLSTSLQKHFEAHADIAKNGDSGLLKIKKAVNDNEDYDLIITSLGYSNTNDSQIKSGEEFIETARHILPGIKVMVYSDDVHPYRIHKLFHYHKINAFVAHGPDSMPEIIDAVKMMATSEVVFLSPKYLPFNQNNLGVDLNDFDVRLLKYLSLGKSQPEISRIFITEGISHASVSTIEKRINKLRTDLNAVNTINLVVLAKEAGII